MLFVILVIFVAVSALPVVAWFNVGISPATNALKLGAAAATPEPGPAYTKLTAFVPAKSVAVAALPVVDWFNVGISLANKALKPAVPLFPFGAAYTNCAVWEPAKFVAVEAFPIRAAVT